MKAKIKIFLENKIVDSFLIILIILNFILFIFQTDSNFYDHFQKYINNFESLSILIFTIEYFLRILTIDKFDVFDPEAYKTEVNTYINEAKKDILTLDKFDVFDAGAYKQELQTIANEVTNKMSVFDGLTEIDLDELKAQIKAEILAELNGAGA